MRNLKPITENSEKKITTFWNYFKKNEQEIYNAIHFGINYDEVFQILDKKLSYISRRIGYIVKRPINNPTHYKFVFTCGGYRKLFAKMIAIEEQAPQLEHFTIQTFIKPIEDVSKYQNGTDEPIDFFGYEIKISEIQVALEDYNIKTKQLKINIYIPYYDRFKEYEDLKSEFVWILMNILGEIAYRKHIKEFKLHQMPLDPIGLLPLIELPDFIDYLYQINSRRKTRII
jgi:hypothetical protein